MTIDRDRLARSLHVLCGDTVTEWPHRVDWDRADRIIAAYEDATEDERNREWEREYDRLQVESLERT